MQYYACFMQFIARRNRPAPSSSREAGAGAGAGNSNNENSSNGDSKDDAGTVMNGAVDMSLASLLPTLHAFHSQTPPVVPPVSDDGDGESDEDDEDGGIDWNITLEEVWRPS